MKNKISRILTALLLLVVCLSLISCAYPIIDPTAVGQNAKGTENENGSYHGPASEININDAAAKYGLSGGDEDAESKIDIYFPSSNIGTLEISHKQITGSAAKEIADLLTDCRLTGEKTNALSGKTCQEIERDGGNLPDSLWGYLWAGVGSDLYRVGSDGQISKVKEFLAEGEEAQTDAENIRGLLGATLSYWPHDYYSGTYKDGKLTLEHTYNAQSEVTIKITDIYIENNKYTENNNTVTLEITSKSDQTDLYVSVRSETGGCVLYRGTAASVNTKAGQPETVTLGFGGSDYRYYIVIKCDNTCVKVNIDLT